MVSSSVDVNANSDEEDGEEAKEDDGVDEDGNPTDTQMNIFFDGLNPTSKSHVNASVRGSLSNKSAIEAFELFDMMAIESQQWAAEHSQKMGIFELSAGSPNMSTQMEKMEKKIDAKFDILLQQIHAQKPFVPSKPPLDDQLAKLAATTQSFIEGNNQRFQNVEASIKSLEQQYGQLAAHISDREMGKCHTPDRLRRSTILSALGLPHCPHGFVSGSSRSNFPGWSPILGLLQPPTRLTSEFLQLRSQ
ncbi:hypothetical protein L3X38_004811 [Prunus dulcis]|uniref:Uncharacterized protein n=1 Tax=Prunus dulcis TaxID=3755 RepID=A0AAD5F3M4_PRUDU|nr:hypothetical protein L3X38_004811 [Prunus dulcis]